MKPAQPTPAQIKASLLAPRSDVKVWPLSDEQARRNRAAAEADEVFSEGRKHRNTLPNRKT